MSDTPAYPPTPGNNEPAFAVSDAKGFLAALFDFKFQTLITPKVVKFVYAVSTVIVVGAWVLWTIILLTESVGAGLLALILGPFVVILYLVFIRMTLELYFAVVRMSDDIHRAYNK